MPEPMTTSATIATATMVGTGAIFADLVIFTDTSYRILAITGSVVGFFSVLHEIFKEKPIEYTPAQIAMEVLKGTILGIFAIPFWYLVLSNSGETLIKKFFSIDVTGTVNSVWLMVAFFLSWYNIPFLDWVVDKVKRGGQNV